jgi:hypothetical protein
MKIFENIINHKINTITANELLKYAKQYNISIAQQEASQVAQYVRGKKINIFNEKERSLLIKEVANITSVDTAKKVNRLLLSFTK